MACSPRPLRPCWPRTEGSRRRVLAAAGSLAGRRRFRGMVGGQVLDMAGEGRALGLTEVEELQRLKTGALI